MKGGPNTHQNWSYMPQHGGTAACSGGHRAQNLPRARPVRRYSPNGPEGGAGWDPGGTRIMGSCTCALHSNTAHKEGAQGAQRRARYHSPCRQPASSTTFAPFMTPRTGGAGDGTGHSGGGGAGGGAGATSRTRPDAVWASPVTLQLFAPKAPAGASHAAGLHRSGAATSAHSAGCHRSARPREAPRKLHSVQAGSASQAASQACHRAGPAHCGSATGAAAERAAQRSRPRTVSAAEGPSGWHRRAVRRAKWQQPWDGSP